MKKGTLPMASSEKFLCRKEIAMRLGISLGTVDRILAAKEIPVIRVGVTGKRAKVLIKESDFEQWLERKTIPANSPARSI